MKQSGSILILTLICFSIVRPLSPFVEYYLNYDYIANVLCINQDKPEMQCNGKCHLTQELSKANDTTHPNDKSIPHIELDKFPIICQAFNNIQFSVVSETQERFTNYSFPIKKYAVQPDTPPPQVC